MLGEVLKRNNLKKVLVGGRSGACGIASAVYWGKQEAAPVRSGPRPLQGRHCWVCLTHAPHVSPSLVLGRVNPPPRGCGRSPRGRAPLLPGYPTTAPGKPAPPAAGAQPTRGPSPRTAIPSLLPKWRRRGRDATNDATPDQDALPPGDVQSRAASRRSRAPRAPQPHSHGATAAPRAPARPDPHQRCERSR